MNDTNEPQNQREQTRQAISTASKAWEKAPIHVKAMAGAYVAPLIEALQRINNELENLKND
jgi:hypothetical protein